MFCSNSDAQTRVTVWLHFAEDSLYYQMLHSVSEHDSRHSVRIHSIEGRLHLPMRKNTKKVIGFTLCLGLLTGCAQTPESSLVKQKGSKSLDTYKEAEVTTAARTTIRERNLPCLCKRDFRQRRSDHRKSASDL